MNLYEAALQIATEAHEGQFRDDGKPYITHPVAVAKIVGNWFSSDSPLYDCTRAVALLHDVVEDTEKTLSDINLDMLRLVDEPHRIRSIVEDVRVLTHGEETYTEYILNIKNSSSISSLVKRADLKHNLSDHKPGARRDKYELAVALLNA